MDTNMTLCMVSDSPEDMFRVIVTEVASFEFLLPILEKISDGETWCL